MSMIKATLPTVITREEAVWIIGLIADAPLTLVAAPDLLVLEGLARKLKILDPMRAKFALGQIEKAKGR